MLDLFEVRDLPHEPAVRVMETTALRLAELVATQRQASVLVVVEGTGRVRGIVWTDSIRRVAQHAPEAAVSTIATMSVVEVPPTMCLVDAVRAVAPQGIAALLAGGHGDGFLVTREALLSFDSWERLVAAREARLERQRHANALDLAAQS